MPTGRHFAGEQYRNGFSVNVSADGHGVVSHAGMGMLRELADLTGLTTMRRLIDQRIDAAHLPAVRAARAHARTAAWAAPIDELCSDPFTTVRRQIRDDERAPSEQTAAHNRGQGRSLRL